MPAGTKEVVLNVTAISPSGVANLRSHPEWHGRARRRQHPDAGNIDYIPGVDKARSLSSTSPRTKRIARPMSRGPVPRGDRKGSIGSAALCGGSVAQVTVRATVELPSGDHAGACGILPAASFRSRP